MIHPLLGILPSWFIWHFPQASLPFKVLCVLNHGEGSNVWFSYLCFALILATRTVHWASKGGGGGGGIKKRPKSTILHDHMTVTALCNQLPWEQTGFDVTVEEFLVTGKKPACAVLIWYRPPNSQRNHMLYTPYKFLVSQDSGVISMPSI